MGHVNRTKPTLNVIVTLMSLVTPTASSITCQNVSCDIGSFFCLFNCFTTRVNVTVLIDLFIFV